MICAVLMDSNLQKRQVKTTRKQCAKVGEWAFLSVSRAGASLHHKMSRREIPICPPFDQLPARLEAYVVALLLGFSISDIPVLVEALSKPAPNSPKFFVRVAKQIPNPLGCVELEILRETCLSQTPITKGITCYAPYFLEETQ